MKNIFRVFAITGLLAFSSAVMANSACGEKGKKKCKKENAEGKKCEKSCCKKGKEKKEKAAE